MSQSLQVAGYDKRTERLSVCLPLPDALSNDARSLASVSAGDDGGGIYPLAPQAAVTLSLKMQQGLNPDLYAWFLEPASD